MILNTNNVKIVFQTAFSRLTTNMSKFYEARYDSVYQTTFNNRDIIQMISVTFDLSIDIVVNYLTSTTFVCDTLICNIGKLCTYVLLNDLNNVEELITFGYSITDDAIKLAIINDNLPMLKLLTKNHTFNVRNLYDSCVTCSESVYFYIRNMDIIPNVAMFNIASCNKSLEIIKDINKYIGVSDEMIKSALITGDNHIVNYLIDNYGNISQSVLYELINTAILYSNFSLLDYFMGMSHIKKDIRWFYSAVLSGNLEMVSFIEKMIPDIHEDHNPDCSQTKKWNNNLLLKDTIYHKNGENYFSHTINYAIQSRSLEMVQYIYNIGYGITISNFITAVKQGTLEIVKYLCSVYTEQLPNYIYYYFGFGYYTDDKLSKAQVLMEYNMFSNNKNKSCNDHKKESIHYQLVSENKTVYPESVSDPDYLKNTSAFFNVNKNISIIITRCNLYLKYNNDFFKKMCSEITDPDTLQKVSNVLFLVGTIHQITEMYPLINVVPDSQIIMEIMMYNQIGKVCFLVKRNLISPNIAQQLYNIAISINHKHFITMFQKHFTVKPVLKNIIMSGNYDMISNYAEECNVVSKNALKQIINLDNVPILSLFRIPIEYREELLEYSNTKCATSVSNYIAKL